MPKGYKRVKFAVKKKGAKGSKSRYGKSFTKRDKFATLSNSPSPFPASLRPGQGSYSRSAFARAAVRSDLEIKNYDHVAQVQPGGPLTAATMWADLTLAAHAVVPNPLPAANAAYLTNLGTLHQIAQGSNSFQREGRKIVIKGLELRHLFTLTSTNVPGDTSVSARLITVLDKQANGAAPIESDIFTLGPNKVSNLYNLDNAQRFSILSDETFELNAQAGIGAVPPIVSVAPTKSKIVKLVTNIPIEYSTIVGDITGIRSNNVFNVLLVSGGAGATLASTYAVRCLFVG